MPRFESEAEEYVFKLQKSLTQPRRLYTVWSSCLSSLMWGHSASYYTSFSVSQEVFAQDTSFSCAPKS